MLFWIFDEEEDVQHALVCYLSDGEALAVVNRNPAVEGVLEPVRSTLELEGALVFAIRPGQDFIRIVPFEIPRSAGEENFIAALFAAADKAHADFAHAAEPLPDRLRSAGIIIERGLVGAGV
jgi:hypothetical protein